MTRPSSGEKTTEKTEGAPEKSKRRRSPGEARAAILKTARRLFSEQGYANTSTRQIAAEAQAAEPLVYRHFGTKANLFDEAMLEPYRTFMADFSARWAEELHRPEEIGDVTERFVRGLYHLMKEHRQLFSALIVARAFDGTIDGLTDGFTESDLSRQLDIFNKYLHDTEAPIPRTLDSAVSFRLIIGAVMAATVLDEWLFPSPDQRPSDARIENELTKFALYGVMGRRPR